MFCIAMVMRYDLPSGSWHDALQLDIERGERLVLEQQARLALLLQRARLVDADAAIDGEGRTG